MTPAEETTLRAEFRLLARHLVRTGGSRYLEERYVAAHRKLGLQPGTGFDRWLLSVARSGPAGIWLADAYTGLLGRTSILRSKLVLVLALLECAPPSFVKLDTPTRGGVWIALTVTAMRGVEFSFAFLFGALVFAPVQLWFAATGPRR